MGLIAWQGGGSAGDDRLRTMGASPFQIARAVALEVGAISVALVTFGSVALWVRNWFAGWSTRRDDAGEQLAIAGAAIDAEPVDTSEVEDDSSDDDEDGGEALEALLTLDAPPSEDEKSDD